MGARIDDNAGVTFSRQQRALLIADDRRQAAATADLIAVSGARVVATVPIADAPARLAAQGPVELIVIEAIGAASAALAGAVDAAARFVDEGDAAVVIAIATGDIDMVSAAMLGERYTLLCAPDTGERLAAINTALARDERTLRLNDAGRENEAQRLQRLNEEVARIADTLARLTRGTTPAAAPPRSILAERSSGYGVEPGEAAPVSAADLRQLIRARRLRDQFFEDGLFEDPAWDMLLDLYAAHLDHIQVSVSSLCIAAAVAPTTALRWIGRMSDSGWLERQPDPFDRRRAYLALSPRALDAIQGYFAMIGRPAGGRGVI